VGGAEEVCGLRDLLHRAAAVRAVAAHQLGLRPEGFTGSAIPALIFAQVDVALVVQGLENVLDRLFMRFIRRPDEPVIGNVEQLPELLDPDHHVVDVLLRCLAGRFGLALDLLAVFVRPGQEHDVIAAQALVAGHGVRGHGRIGMTDVQLVTRVINRCRDIKGFAHGSVPPVFLMSRNRPATGQACDILDIIVDLPAFVNKMA